MKNRVLACLACALFICSFPFGAKAAEGMLQQVDQLDAKGITIGVPQGAAAMYVAEERFQNAEILYYSSVSEGYTAVEYGKIDAFLFDSHALEYVAASNDQLAVMDQEIGEENIVIGAPFGKEDLIADVNAFIAQYKYDGTYDDMYHRWLRAKSDEMPDIKPPETPTRTIVIGTEGLNEPMNYYGEGNLLTGFDVEFAKRLGVYLNAEIKLEAMTFDALLASAASGKIDLMIANLNGTEERRETMLLSDSYVNSHIAALVKKSRLPQPPDGIITDMQQLNEGKKVGILTGSIYDDLAVQVLPGCEQVFFNNYTDMGIAVSQDKISAFFMDEPMARYMKNEMPSIEILCAVQNSSYAFTLPKTERGQQLAAQLDEYVAKAKSDGTLKALDTEWFNVDESVKEIEDFSKYPATNGTLHVATNSNNAPFGYVKDGKMVGYEIELLANFCKEQGYALAISDMDFAALLVGVQTGAYDLGCSCITVTEERKESMLFTTPHYEGGDVLVIKSQKAIEQQGFFAGLAESFQKNFIDENRYLLILQGIQTTLVITIAAAALGTALGFGVCMMRRAKAKWLSVPAKGFIRIMQGMPIVVFLMILYYIIFRGVDISSVVVAIIGFALNFAAYVSEMMRTGIDAVDKGQTEAAAAIGFNRVQTFVKIVLPQAARHFLPVFKGEFISLLKTTSVVGYIAIQDLTKMSDIIRSRTFEAFFPLIATAIIYFLLAYLLTLLLNTIEIKIDPKRRKRTVKGVRNQ